ncbi:MAG: universal stress protein [Pseudomonadota bacterium]
MYNNILVPMALDHGIGETTVEIARKLLSEGGQITALHVHEKPQNTVTAYVDDSAIENAYSRAEEILAARVAKMPGVTGKVVSGHSGRTIIDVANDMRADCIVMGSHKPGLIDYFLGSTASRVTQHAPCAVHVARYPG